MTQPNLPGATPAASATTASLVTPPDHEIVYYEGRPLLRADQAKATFWVLVGFGLVALAVCSWTMDWGWPGWVGAVLIVLAILAVVIPILVMRTTRYRITSY